MILNKTQFKYLFLLLLHRLPAQQSLFNVPSISVTNKKEVFFQEQGNILVDGSNVINFNTAYGLGKQFEVGINLIGVGFDIEKHAPTFSPNSSSTDNKPYNPILMLTSLKAFEIKENIVLGVGAQAGFNPTQNKIGKHDIATFDFANLRFEFPEERLMICAGGYYSNIVYMGMKDQVGGLFGFEYTIVKHKLVVMGDWMIGKNSSSVIVPGIVYNPHHNIALSFGWQFASPGTTNPQGLVFELTLGNFL